MLPIVFSLSQKTFVQAKQRFYSLSFIFLMFPFVFLFTPLGVDMPWTLSFVISGILFLVFLIFTKFFSSKLIKSQFGTLRITLTNIHLIRKNRNVEEYFPYDEMKRLLIQQTRSGEVIGLKIKSLNKTILIGGLENMDLLAKLLEEQLPESVYIKKRTAWINLQNPYILFFVALGCTSLGILFGQLPHSSIQNLQLFINLSIPLIFIFLRPVSRVVGEHYRKKERLLGYILLAVAIVAGGMLLWIRDFKVFDFPPCGLAGRYIQQSGCIRSFDTGSSSAFLLDNETLVVDSFKSIVILPINGRMNYWTPKIAHDDYVMDFWVSENGRILASTTFEDKTFLHIWDLETKTLLKTLQPDFRSFALSPDGQNIAFSDYVDEVPTIGFWQIESWEKTEAIPGYSPFAYSPDGTFFVNIDPEENIAIRNLQSGEIVTFAEIPDESGRLFIDNFVFSSDGAKLAGLFAPSKSIYVWETSTGKVLHSWEIESRIEEEVFTFTPDGQFLIAGFHNIQNKDGLIIWDLSDGNLHKIFELGEGYKNRPRSIDISPDSSLLAVGTLESLLIYEMEKFLE